MRVYAATVLALLIVAAACSGDGGTSPTATPDPTATPRAPSPAPIAASPTAAPLMTLPDESSLAEVMLGCLRGAPASAQAAADALIECAESDEYDLTVNAVVGEMAALLADFRTTARCFGTVSFIAWFEGGWQVQNAESLLANDDTGTLVTSAPNTRADGDRARTVIHDGVAYLGIINANAECGSGAPHESYLLLGLGEGAWDKRWDSTSDIRTSFGYPLFEFVGTGIDHLHLEGDSFTRQDDRRMILFESKLGPHRLFEQEWLRDGETYGLESEVTLPTPYGRLIDFVYALSDQANSALLDMVMDPALIQQALDSGLAQDPIGLEWHGFCGEAAPLSPPPCTVMVPQRGKVIIDMVQVDGRWLISSIEAE